MSTNTRTPYKSDLHAVKMYCASLNEDEKRERIATIQERLSAAGYQWQERVINDGIPENCIIHTTMNPDVHWHHHSPETIGWGRFTRSVAWELFYRWAENVAPRSYEEFLAARETTKEDVAAFKAARY